MANFIRCQMFWQLFGTFHSFWHFLVQLLETFAIFWQHSPSLGNFCNLFCNFWYLFHFWDFFWNLFQLFTTFGFCWEKSRSDATAWAPKARRPMFGPLCIRPTILPFLCSCPFLVSMFAVGLCVLWVLCGPSKATVRCYTSICDGIILWGSTMDHVKADVLRIPKIYIIWEWELGRSSAEVIIGCWFRAQNLISAECCFVLSSNMCDLVTHSLGPPLGPLPYSFG